MTPTPAELAAVPAPLRARYARDPARWGPAIVATARQRAGLPDLPADAGPPADAWLDCQHLTAWTGYGRVGLHLAAGLAARGLRVVVTAAHVDERYAPLPAWLAPLRSDAPPAHPRPVRLAIGTPGMGGDAAPAVALTMWETDRLAPADAAALNRRAGVIVPSAHAAAALRDSGVTAPVRVVPLGVDLGTFRPSDDCARNLSGAVAFGTAGRTRHGGVRKGLGDVARAFLAASIPGAVLRVKCWPDDRLPDVPDDPRIEIDRRPRDGPGLAAWYRGLTAYVTASRGEGWGLQTHEAMACGVPVIAAPHSGTAEFWTPACGWGVPYRLAEAHGPVYGGHGARWAVASHVGLVAALRAAASDPAEARRRGEAAARRAAEFPWSRTVAGVLDALAAWSRPAPAEVRAVLARQERCAFAQRTACRCHCDRLGRVVSPWTDCRGCEFLPA